MFEEARYEKTKTVVLEATWIHFYTWMLEGYIKWHKQSWQKPCFYPLSKSSSCKLSRFALVKDGLIDDGYLQITLSLMECTTFYLHVNQVINLTLSFSKLNKNLKIWADLIEFKLSHSHFFLLKGPNSFEHYWFLIWKKLHCF